MADDLTLDHAYYMLYNVCGMICYPLQVTRSGQKMD
jgi:hypothetical protein